jgi:hypothetical protein
MIKTKFRTNLDGYSREKWPDGLPAVPSIDQWVKSKSGKVLKICGLTWDYDGTLLVELK